MLGARHCISVLRTTSGDALMNIGKELAAHLLKNTNYMTWFILRSMTM